MTDKPPLPLDREHKLGCDSYHLHHAPTCCARDCWCLLPLITDHEFYDPSGVGFCTQIRRCHHFKDHALCGYPLAAHRAEPQSAEPKRCDPAIRSNAEHAHTVDCLAAEPSREAAPIGIDPEVDSCAITLHERFCAGDCEDGAAHVEKLARGMQLLIEELFDDAR